MIIVISIAILGIYVAKKLLSWYGDRGVFFKKLQNFPQPKALPILGNALDLINTTDVIPSLLKYVSENGHCLKVKILNRYYILCSDPESVEAILSSNKTIAKSEEYHYFHNWLGDGLLTSTGNKWRQARKIITPTFHFNILEQYISVFDNCSNILIDRLMKESDKKQTDIYSYVTLCTMDAICETAMGIKLNSQENQNSDYVNAIRKMGGIIIRRSTSVFKQIDSLFKFSNDYKVEQECLAILHKTTEKVINNRREYMKNNLEEFAEASKDDGYGKKRMAFLDLLLKYNMDSGILSDQDIRNEVATFMFEGHDTTSSAVCFTLYCLGKNPEIQKLAFEEIKEVLDDDKKRPTSYKDLSNLNYLDKVIKEALRLYPSVPIFTRQIEEDVQLKDKVIPKGVTVIIGAYTLHRHPDYFAQPEKFNPERFNPENQSKRPAYAYVPFSAGPRNCIGQKFAMLELKCIISKVLRNFEIHSVPNFQPKLAAETILKSENGIFVRLVKRC